MDTPEKKPVSSIANRPRVTPSPTTNLKKKEYIKRCVFNCVKFVCLTFTYFLSSVSYCSWVKFKGKQAFTLFSCKENIKIKVS